MIPQVTTRESPNCQSSHAFVSGTATATPVISSELVLNDSAPLTRNETIGVSEINPRKSKGEEG